MQKSSLEMKKKKKRKQKNKENKKVIKHAKAKVVCKVTYKIYLQLNTCVSGWMGRLCNRIVLEGSKHKEA